MITTFNNKKFITFLYSFILLVSASSQVFSQTPAQQLSPEAINITGYVLQKQTLTPQQQQQNQQQLAQQQQAIQHQQSIYQQQQQTLTPQQQQQAQMEYQKQIQMELQKANRNKIESGLTLEILEEKINSGVEDGEFNYDIYDKLPGYIVELSDGNVSLEALPLDILNDDLPEGPILNSMPSENLYVHESEILVLSDLSRYTRQSNDPIVQYAHNKIQSRQRKLKEIENERLRRENLNYNHGLSPQQQQISNYASYGFGVLQRIETDRNNGFETAFSSNNSLQVAKGLFALNIRVASKFANPNSRLNLKTRLLYGRNPYELADKYLKSAEEIILFANGLRDGALLTLVDFKDNGIEIKKTFFNLMNDPEASMEKFWQIITNIEPQNVAMAVLYQLNRAYGRFVNGGPREKGEVVGQIVTDVMLGATLMNYFDNIQRFTNGIGRNFTNKLDYLAETSMFVSNDVGAIGLITKKVIRIVPKNVKSLVIQTPQLQSKLKHSKIFFGTLLNDNPSNIAKYKKAIYNHINEANTIAIKGTYSGGSKKVNAVVHYYNKETKIDIMFLDRSLKYHTGVKLSPEQVNSLYKKSHVQ